MAPRVPDFDQFLHAIADPVRRGILQALKLKNRRAGVEGLLCASDIEQRVRLAQPTISHHMRILEDARVVEATREGHKRRYRRNEKLISEMMRRLKQQL